MVLSEGLFQYRADRLIAACRIVLALASFAAIAIDSSQPRQFAPFAYWLLLTYMCFAVALAFVIWSSPIVKCRLGLAAHVVDMLTFILLLYITEGTTSPHFPFFVFVLLSAVLKWSARGALWTTAAMFLLFVPTGFGFYASMFGSDLDIQRFIIRTSNLMVVGGILVFFGLENERIARELLKLGSFPHDEGGGLPVREALQYAAGIFNVERALLVWSDTEEPWRYVAEIDSGKFRQEQVPPDRYYTLIAEPLASTAFLYQEDRGDAIYPNAKGALVSWDGPALNRDFAEAFRIGNAVSVPLKIQTGEGHLFILGVSSLSAENMAIAAAIAAQIGASLDRAAVKSARREAESAEQRLRLARDLHDGILQFLAGAGMQLEAIVQAMRTSDRRGMEERMLALQDALLTEQRDLRAFIQQLRPGAPLPPATASSLATDLPILVDRLSQQWGVDVTLRLEPIDIPISSQLQHEVNQTVREAVANAVRHGRARQINIDAAVRESMLHLKIADDGCGLPVAGTFVTEELETLRLGPRSLRERTKSLQGTFTLRSDNDGTMVDMAIPLTSMSN